MNRTQKICMWLGINTLILFGFVWLNNMKYDNPSLFLFKHIFIVLLVALVTVGLILTFKDKKPKDEQKQ